ncbi:MAG: hypothetical protein HON34_05235 [Pelagibacteraceae bacterium]|jgi:hypothetical protein|nr:hypothetical protein [Pelagibacteraceae bacterium]
MDIIKLKDRSKYLKSQIERSIDKFSYCKLDIDESLAFHLILNSVNVKSGPILCLGTRNGREIDLFRNVFFKNRLIVMLIKFFQRRKNGFTSILPMIEGFGRSKVSSINDKSVIGVEINPNAVRKDVLIGSFDEMPVDWNDKFSILYSNSFDQSQDPYKTAEEWKRVICKGAILILGFTNLRAPFISDPVGNLEYTDFIDLFGGELIYFDKNTFNYSYIILKL